MRDGTLDKIMFGAWAVCGLVWLAVFAAGCAEGEPDADGLLLAAYCAVVCILYRRLWREKAPEHYVNIYVLPDGREIRKEEWK